MRTALQRHGARAVTGPPGTYALLCFVPGDKTGHPHVAMGMHKVVVLK